MSLPYLKLTSYRKGDPCFVRADLVSSMELLDPFDYIPDDEDLRELAPDALKGGRRNHIKILRGGYLDVREHPDEVIAMMLQSGMPIKTIDRDDLLRSE